ncbi:MAG TPA: hypothetical protein DF383_11300 [Deltaproteobacteria bacterium]|nr:hypothetical protein [Deltaproteobacteria bacterium]
MKVKPSKILAILIIFHPVWLIASAFAGIVEVPGASLPALLGKPVATIRLFAKNSEGRMAPIPYQIDERASQTAPWFLDQTPKNTPGLGVLDPQDVLLFMQEDAGPAASASELPAAGAGMEITVDAASGRTVYALLADETAPRSSRSYISYQAAQDRVSSSFYEAGFKSGSPLIQDTLILHNGEKTTDILDRFKIRLKLAIKNFFDFKIEEGGIDSRLVGYRSGPIRVLRRVVATKKLGPIRVAPQSKIDFLFYPAWIEVPTKIHNPIDGPKFLEDKTVGFSGYDFSSSIYGSRLFSSLGGAPITLNGTSGAKKLPGDLTWWALSGPAGSLAVSIRNDPQLARAGVAPLFVVHDDSRAANPPESEAGESFVGFDLPYDKIPKGDYTLLLKQVFPYRFDSGQIDAYLKAAKTVQPGAVKAL